MKKLYAIYLIFALIGYSDNKAELKNRYQAWSDTYWGMTEQQLLNFIKLDNTSSEINKGECNKEYIQSQNLESCQSISLDNYGELCAFLVMRINVLARDIKPTPIQVKPYRLSLTSQSSRLIAFVV